MQSFLKPIKLTTIDTKEKYYSFFKHIHAIYEKYDQADALTGRSFNVIKMLGHQSDELSHSIIISELLNSKGSHGQKDKYLKIFVENLRENVLTEKNDFKINTSTSKSITEKSVGTVDLDVGSGGRLDIVVKDQVGNEIIIENKIYAIDQPKQLLRYSNYNKEALILYLTPFEEDEPSEDSLGDLKIGIDVHVISYEEFIVEWIEKCIKESAELPIIRETLIQYLYLIQEITNQSKNKEMSNEIIDLVLENENNFDSFKAMINNEAAIIEKLQTIFLDKLEAALEKSKHEAFTFKSGLKKDHYKFMDFEHEKLAMYNLKFRFEFRRKSDVDNLTYGLYKLEGYDQKKNEFPFIDKFKSNDYREEKSQYWLANQKMKSQTFRSLRSKGELGRLYFDTDILKDEIDKYIREFNSILGDTLNNLKYNK